MPPHLADPELVGEPIDLAVARTERADAERVEGLTDLVGEPALPVRLQISGDEVRAGQHEAPIPRDRPGDHLTLIGGGAAAATGVLISALVIARR